MKTRLFHLLATLLTLIAFTGTVFSASAAVSPDEELSPQASVYLGEYTAWAVRSSSNQVYVYYDVTANSTIGCLGAKLIVIQMKEGSSWTTVKTYSGSTSNGMLARNDISHSGNIVYQGSSGNKYRAVVTIFGGSSTTSGDSRIVTTNTV